VNPQIERAVLLFQQGRHELAEKELRQVVAADPQEAYPRCLLAMCLSEREQYKEATEEAQQAIALAPDHPFAHYAHAQVLSDRNRPDEALKAVEEAVRLDPFDANYCALEAQCLHAMKKWPECLAATERGLEINAEHTGCANLRAIALVKLGRREEAAQVIDATLAKQPESAVTHANMGWTLLHQGDPKKALHHFREALRLDPGSEWAQAGIVEALKARNFIYALMLKYFLFMSRLSSNAQWGIIIGGYVIIRLLGNMADENHGLAPWILPIRILYISFALMSWLASPLFNLMLRLSPFGRLVLSREQVVESNWIGTFVALALGSLTGCLIMGFNSPWVVSLAVFGLIIMPVSGTFRTDGSSRKIMIALTSLLVLIGLASITQIWRSYQGDSLWIKALADEAFSLLGVFGVGVLGSALLANFLAGRRKKL